MRPSELVGLPSGDGWDAALLDVAAAYAGEAAEAQAGEGAALLGLLRRLVGG